MKFTVSRASDQFMSDPHPTPHWSPHPKAEWDKDLCDWVMKAKSVEELTDLCTDKGIRLIMRKMGKIVHVEIDDLTNNHF